MLSLIKKTLQNEANRINGIFEDIEYIQISSHSTVQTRAIIEYPKFEDKKKNNVEDIIVFHSISLDFTPKTADIILYDGNRYVVSEYKKVSSLYDITAVKSLHNRGRV